MANPVPKMVLPAIDNSDKIDSARQQQQQPQQQQQQTGKSPRTKNGGEQQKGKSPRTPVPAAESKKGKSPRTQANGQEEKPPQLPLQGLERGGKQKTRSVTSKTPVSDMTIKSPRTDGDRTQNHSRETRAAPKTKASSRNETPVSCRSWVTYGSPLWRKDKVKTDEQLSQSMPTTPRVLSQMETGFINDAICTHVFSTRRKPIIPPYDARSDKYAQAYFKSPFVQGIVERNSSMSMNSSVAHLKELKMAKTVNKLSVRRRCKPTPDVNSIRQRETAFVNDAIITEKKRTKYKDIIKPYNAADDKLCKDYFQRDDIKRLVNRTCAPELKTAHYGVMT